MSREYRTVRCSTACFFNFYKRYFQLSEAVIFQRVHESFDINQKLKKKF